MAPRYGVPLEDEVLNFVRKSEEAIVEVGRKWTDAIAEFVPVEMPLVRDLRKQVFDSVEDLLRMQREFAQKILEETRKVVLSSTKPAPTHAPAKRARPAA